MTYSQNDEEGVILDFFKGETGTVLDIGAFDGITFSNTLALIELGWGGVLVEASPHAFIALENRFKTNPSIELVNACAGEQFRLRRFWDTPDAIATDDEAHRKKWEKSASYIPTWVAEVPIDAILRLFPRKYDFINIDIEGKTTELIFDAIDYRAVGCRLVCVEHDLDKMAKFREIAIRKNLREIHKTSENFIFAVDY